MIVVDGSYGEGGGQILRTAVALAAITGKACRVERIRAGRPKPGLAASHLTALRAAAAVCGGVLKGAEIGSSAVAFEPGEIHAYLDRVHRVGALGPVASDEAYENTPAVIMRQERELSLTCP